jgi:hypothetical protein
MYDMPSYVWALVLIGVIGIPAITSVMLHGGAVDAMVTRRTAVIVPIVAAYLLAAWIVASGILAGTGVYLRNSGEVAPWFGLAAGSTLIALLLATRIPVMKRILADPGTPARLTWPHTFRVVGVSFLIAMALGDLPAVFALPAGLGDIATGLAAPFVARKLARGEGHRDAVWFNWFGIADLVVALSIGLFAGLGPWLLLDFTPSTDALAQLPLAVVPTTAVPLAIALHIVSLGRLRAAAREAAREARESNTIRLLDAMPVEEGLNSARAPS